MLKFLHKRSKNETGISVNIIDQTVEGNVAYYNALKKYQPYRGRSCGLGNWGQEVFQLVAKGDDEYQFHMGAMGSVSILHRDNEKG